MAFTKKTDFLSKEYFLLKRITIWSVWFSLFSSKEAVNQPEVFWKKVIIRNFTKFKGKYLCRSHQWKPTNVVLTSI